MRAALLAFVASAGLAAWSLSRALRLDPIPTMASRASETADSVPPRPAAVPSARLAAAVERNPFHPERRRPAIRFRLPGEAAPSSPVSAPVTDAAAFKLIGTAVMAEGRGFAMCQQGIEPPKLVRIGERIGDLTLRQVAQGRAVFITTAGQRMELHVPKAGT